MTALLADQVTAARLARAIDARLLDTEGWNTVALLALLRVTLIVAAGGGWSDPVYAAQSVGAALEPVAQAPPDDDAEVEASRAAAILVALAVIASVSERWDNPSDELVEAFERCRTWCSPNPSEVDATLVAHFAADLEIGFGMTLTAQSVLDAAEFLLGSTAIERAVESLATEYSDLTLEAPRLLRIRVAGNPYLAAMRILTRVAHLAPIAVRACAPTGNVYVAWRPKTLILQRNTAAGSPIGGSLHRLAVGPGAHITSMPASSQEKWQGSIPTRLADELTAAQLAIL